MFYLHHYDRLSHGFFSYFLGNVLQALPRFDTASELEYQDPLQVQELINDGDKLSVDGDKLIINGHVVEPNVAQYYDVINRREQDHLFGHNIQWRVIQTAFLAVYKAK